MNCKMYDGDTLLYKHKILICSEETKKCHLNKIQKLILYSRHGRLIIKRLVFNILFTVKAQNTCIKELCNVIYS